MSKQEKDREKWKRAMKFDKRMKIVVVALIAVVVLAGVGYGMYLAIISFHQTLTVPIPQASLYGNYNSTTKVFSDQISNISDQSTLWKWYPATESFNATFWIENIGTVPFQFAIRQPTGLASGWEFGFVVYVTNTWLNTTGAFCMIGVSVFITNTTMTVSGASTGTFYINVEIRAK